MTDPFRKHGISHLSPSALGLFRDSPSLWALQYLWKFRSEDAAPRAWLGKAVEAGVDWALFEGTHEGLDGALVAARKQFELDAVGEATDEIEECRKLIPDMLQQAVLQMQPFGRPIARQYRVETWLDGIEVGVVGYCDYVYSDKILDLKTGKQLPSAPKPDHKAQIAVYSRAKDLPAGLVYATAKKGATYMVPAEDCDEAIRSLRLSALALRRRLMLSRTREDFAAMEWPNCDHFRWDSSTKAKAMEIWR